MDMTSVIRRVWFDFDKIWSPALMGIVPLWHTAVMANKHTHTLCRTDRDLTEKSRNRRAVVHRLTELYYGACILELAVFVYYRTLVMFCISLYFHANA